MGVPAIFSPLLPQLDTKFFDPQNIWYRFDSGPLKRSLERFAKFPYSFGRYPLYTHKLQLQLSLESRYYTDIQKTSSKHNKSKQHEERIGTSIVKYLVYPNGKTMVFVACSNCAASIYS
jgi:hypothetical protein